ncbi:MAG: ferredoxin [Acidimicrobiales bacterium]|jgi:ferredoxin
MAMSLRVDQDECMSSGKCVANHPDTFDFDDDELVVLTSGASSTSDEIKIHAARNCPSGAIKLFDHAGNPVDV